MKSWLLNLGKERRIAGDGYDDDDDGGEGCSPKVAEFWVVGNSNELQGLRQRMPSLFRINRVTNETTFEL